MAKAKRHPARKIVTAVVLVLIALVCVLFVSVWAMWEMAPSWWTDNEAYLAEHDAKLAQVAGDIESRLISELSQADAAGERTVIEVPYREANAWLRQRFPQWARNQGHALPPPLSNFMIAHQSGKPVLAFRVSTPEIEQVFSMRFDVTITSRGVARVKLDDFRAGRLDIPAETLVEHLRNKLPAYNIGDLVQLVEGMRFDPVFKHPGHTNRNLRVVGFEATESAIRLTVEAEPR
jgi:hypothetical protein